MDNVYSVGLSARGEHTIIIHRKPSDIPARLDIELMKAGSWGDMNGPKSVCTFHFFNKEMYGKGIRLLQHRGWYESQ